MTIRITIKVKYSCPLCKIKNREVEVTARENEDVIKWLEGVCMPDVIKDHSEISPFCLATSLKELYIPIQGDKVGGAIKQ